MIITLATQDKTRSECRCAGAAKNGTLAHVAAAATNANAPVLGVDWASDGTSLFTCGADNMAMRCALANGAIQPTPVAKHDAPIKAMSWWSDVNLLVSSPPAFPPALICPYSEPRRPSFLQVTGGFDDRMMFWDTRQAQPVHCMPCPGKVQCIASKVEQRTFRCACNRISVLIRCASGAYHGHDVPAIHAWIAALQERRVSPPCPCIPHLLQTATLFKHLWHARPRRMPC